MLPLQSGKMNLTLGLLRATVFRPLFELRSASWDFAALYA